MRGRELNKRFEKLLEKQGFCGKIVSIEHVGELQEEINGLHKKDLLDKELYRTYLASFDFECRQRLANARSLIIASVPQPQVRVTFIREDQSYPIIVPPTYFFLSDNHVTHLLGTYFESQGYKLQKARLPEKLMAVRSGLAQYGKNNITYIEGMGSFHRPVVFVSDAPCLEDSWGKATVMKLCETCSACQKACPSNAIGSDRFQLHAERCLTFHNERPNAFPSWLSPAWHNSLVGCMICQKVCPANKKFVKWIEAGATFSTTETDLILNGVSEERLPRETIEKLEKHGILEYFNVLARNLRALIEKPS